VIGLTDRLLCSVWHVSSTKTLRDVYNTNAVRLVIKAVLLETWRGLECSRKLKFPDFVTTAQDGGKVVSLTHRPLLPQGNTPGTHFYSRLSRPQGHSAIGRIMSMKNSNDTSWDRTSDLPTWTQHLNHCATAVPIRLVIISKSEN